jgi:hypothetical protein
MVAGYQRRPPWAVGTRSALGPFAIAARLVPAVRSRLIRSLAYWEMVGGRPSRTPCARVAAGAALGSLGDRLPLEGGEAGERVRVRFFGRRRLEGAVERDQRPSPAAGRLRPGCRGRAARARAGRGWRRRAPACQRPRAAATAPRSRGAAPPRPSGRSPSTSSSKLPALAPVRGRDRPLAAPRARRGRYAAGRRSPPCIAETICCIGVGAGARTRRRNGDRCPAP